MNSRSNQLAVVGGAIIDGNGGAVIDDGIVLIEDKRIKAVGDRSMDIPQGARRISAAGKFIIPGLMNANVHLMGDIRLENLTRHMGRYEELIAEAAQVALKSGLTTLFDTHGPRRFLITVRDSINSGETIGSRIFCAGNIVGFDGPFSADFLAKVPEVASSVLVKRINAIWVENTGRHLMWLTPEQVANELGAYVRKGIDFVKYASNDHFPGCFLCFSPQAQTAIVDEAHRARLTAQAHSTSVEGLRIAIEAGCDLITHCNITGPNPIPESTLELFVKRKTGAVVFPFTQRRWDWIMKNVSDAERAMWQASDTNARNLIQSDASLLLANDGAIFAPEMAMDPYSAKMWFAPGEDNLIDLGTGHFTWFKAMEEKGCPPIKMLQAATRNIAVAYGKDRDLGTLEPGKFADMVILDRNPLQAADNYRSIHMILKEGSVVDRDFLPLNPILTKPIESPPEEEASYVPFVSAQGAPVCPMCMQR